MNSMKTKRPPVNKGSLRQRLSADKLLIIMVLPAVIYFIVFKYIPILGNIIAFQDYNPQTGFLGSEWVGFKWFQEFFQSYYFTRLMKNTFLLAFLNLLFSFPIPILFALLLNELGETKFKRVTQTVSYMPHFISLTIIIGVLTDLCAPNGVINTMLLNMGVASPINFMDDSQWFRPLYISSGIWQSFGYNAIVYLAAIAGIDQSLYEASSVDGATRVQKMLHITLPSLVPTAVILLIMNCGRMFAVGAEKILLMYSPATYATADVISTYVYRRGILGADFSFATAVGLFESVINVLMLLMVNKLSKKVSESALW